MKLLKALLGLIGLGLLVGGGVVFFLKGKMNPLAISMLASGAVLILGYVATNFGAILDIFTARSVKYGVNTFVMVVIALAICVFVQLIAAKHNKRFDLTAQGRYSISPQSQKIVKELKQDVKLTGFFRESTPEDRRKVQDLLEIYSHFSPKFKFEFIDPDNQPQLAEALGVTAYNTVVIECGDKREKVEAADEQKITNALVKVTRTGQRVLYFTKGHGEGQISDTSRSGFSQLKKAAESETYKVQDIFLAESDAGVPQDCSVLVVAGPTTSFFQPELDAIDDYIRRAGKVIFLIGPEDIDDWPQYLQKYGVDLRPEFVVDPNPVNRFLGVGPESILVQDFPTHEITKEFRFACLFPTVGAVEKKNAPEKGVNVSVLARSGADSWAETDLSALKEGKKSVKMDASERKGPISLAVAVTIESDAPVMKKPESVPAPSTEEPQEKKEPTPDADKDNKVEAAEKKDEASKEPDSSDQGDEKKKPEARLVVFGDADFVTNNHLRNENANFFMNSVAWLTQEKDLISIRPKDLENTPITVTGRQVRVVFAISIILMPLIVLFWGAATYVVRRRTA